MNYLTYLAHRVYLVTCDAITDGVDPIVRPAHKDDLRDPQVRLGCIQDGRTIPLSDAEKKILRWRHLRDA